LQERVVTPDQIERKVYLPVSPAEVWSALTDGARVSVWFGGEVDIEPRRGGRVRVRFPDGRRRDAVIETWEVDCLLILRWMPFEQDARGRPVSRLPTTVRFALEPHDLGTLLLVRESRPDLRGVELDARVGA
jgi:uncharacterized protein YndB with AHSA1/START domain